MFKKLKTSALVLTLAAPLAALADAASDAKAGLSATAGASGIDTGSTVPQLIGTVIKSALGLVGVIFLILMVYGGYIWMIARGDEAKVTKAKDTITNAIIGIVIVAGAYAITNYIVAAFTKS